MVGGGEVEVFLVVRPLFHGVWPFLEAEILARVKSVWVRPPLGVILESAVVVVVDSVDSSDDCSFSRVSFSGEDDDDDDNSSDGSIEAVVVVAIGGSMVVVTSSTLEDTVRGKRGRIIRTFG